MPENPAQHADAYHYDVSPHGITATRSSASVVVPFLMEQFQPQSVIDFGCGLGDWLAEFKTRGCGRILGIDGDSVVAEHLQIPKECFQRLNLAGEYEVTERFDLATSFEVAEHFLAPAGDRLVETMTKCADLIVFGAAVPDQGGYKHVNEQWQSYWIAKFAARGFAAFDLIRPRIWMNPQTNWWYQQNTLMFANAAAQQRFGLTPRAFMADLVHPSIYDWHRDPNHWGAKDMLRMLAKKISRRFGLPQS